MNFKERALYWIKFDDHSVGCDNHFEIEVVGWVVKDSPKSVLLTHWNIQTECEETWNNNIEKTCILKSAILKRKLLKLLD